MAQKKYLDLPGLQVYDTNIKELIRTSIPIFYDTTANWNAHPELVSVAGYIYVYSDYQTDGDDNIPGIKVGDGNAYLIDLPFTDSLYKEHIEDTVSHITSAERTAWNNKITCYISPTDPTNLIFTKDNIII